MKDLKVGDIVSRKSYNHDILFKIVEIVEAPYKEKRIILKGVDLRIMADSPENDLDIISQEQINKFNKSYNKRIQKIVKNILRDRKLNQIKGYTRHAPEYLRNNNYFGRAGRVLHIDGDGEYLDICLKIYEQLEINAVGKIISESEQPKIIGSLLKEHKPDILVLTGHDSLVKGYRNFTNIENYRNSMYFTEAVKEARQYEPSMDELVIFAGACQSLYEAIIEAGANFASSPHRTLAEWREWFLILCHELSAISH